MKAIGDGKKNKGIAAAAAGSASATAPQLPVQGSIESLAETKSKVFQLNKRGYTVNAFIADRKRKAQVSVEELQVFKILKLTESTVHCVHVGGPPDESGQANKNMPTDDLSNFAVVAKLHCPLSEWRQAAPLCSAEYGVEMVKHAIHIELFNLAEKHDAGLRSIDVWENPSRVKTIKNIAAKKLVLVPVTRNIAHFDPDKAPPLTKAFDLGKLELPCGGNTKVFHLMPQYRAPADGVDGWVSPCWLVHEDEQPTMELTMKTCELKIGSHTAKVAIPCLTNSNALVAGAVLSRRKVGCPGAV